MKYRKVKKGLLAALAVILLALCISRFLVQRTRVNGDSMAPTLEEGDSLLIDKISYRFHAPQRFDIVVFPYQYKENTYYIKRIIGLPGETVQISDSGVIYVNGRALIEHYGTETVLDAGLARKEIHLEEDEYFVLGDNRNSSMDSREPSVANIRLDDIVGKAWLCLLPVKRFGVLD